jgi:hypothetical protein
LSGASDVQIVAPARAFIAGMRAGRSRGWRAGQRAVLAAARQAVDLLDLPSLTIRPLARAARRPIRLAAALCS